MGRREIPANLPLDVDAEIPLGTKLRVLRNASGVSIINFAKRAGCTAAYITQVELGYRNPSHHFLTGIARLLQIEPIDLIEANRETIEFWINSSKKSKQEKISTPADLFRSSRGLLTIGKLKEIIRMVVREEIRAALREYEE